jgi:hypothetical protein
MTTEQENYLHMNYVVRDQVEATDPTIIDMMPGFSDYFTEFLGNINILGDQLVLQSANRNGFSSFKFSQRGHMVGAAILIEDKIKAFASNTNNVILFDAVNHNESELMRVKDTECKALCEGIYNSGIANLADMGGYLLTADELAAFKVAIFAFNVSIPQPSSQRNIKKQATTEIKKLFDRNKFLLKKMDNLVPMLRGVAPTFLMEYFYSRKVAKPAYRKLAARFKVVDGASAPVEKALIVNTELGLKRKTTAKGGLLLSSAADGVYSFIITKAGYAPVVREVAITRGERAEVKIVMSYEL